VSWREERDLDENYSTPATSTPKKLDAEEWRCVVVEGACMQL